MGYFQDGSIRLTMKQPFKIHYGLKVMMGGTRVVPDVPVRDLCK